MNEDNKRIFEYSLEEIMGERFGKYSKYIIQDRAIPDVRDGLKPVQRRILFSMYKEKNTYDKPYKKSARAVGDVMGKYHPHGDSSIYDAIVRMSQDWKMKEPFVDMQGNNGSIDGDSAAASRYTEARLSKISNEMLRDIDKETVTFAPNYDDTLLEPTVLPSRFPNLLVNGTTGISAGYATNIPPHNLEEVIDATIYRIDNPNSRLDTLLNYVKGPDFPTGGQAIGMDGIRQAYETGRGKIIIRSKINLEKNKIIITEIPYEVNKQLLVKRIDEIRLDKKIDGIIEVRDESDKEGLQITIELKKDANSKNILNYLYKNTELQVSYNYNMIAIVNRRPMQLGLIPILDAYIEHQKDVVTKRSQYDLSHAKHRYHIVEGLIKAISILDAVIKTIRGSKNKADAIVNLVKEYDFTEEQATEIVTLQLYRLTNTDIISLQEEKSNLEKIMAMLEEILASKEKLNTVIKEELRKIKKEYGTERKTEIVATAEEIKIDTTEMIQKEDVVVVVTHDGYVKRVSLRSYATNNDETSLKDGDYVIGLYNINTTQTVLVFTDKGNYLFLPVFEIPEVKWKDMGKHVSNIVTMSSDEKIIGAMPVYNFEADKYITVFTKNGMVKRTKLIDFKVGRYTKEVGMIKLSDNDKVIAVSSSDETDLFVATKNGYGLWYDISEVSVVGIRASGVKSIKLKDDEVVSSCLFNPECEYITIITDKGTAKRMKLNNIEKTSRANRGILLMKEIKSNPSKIIKCYLMSSKEEIIVTSIAESKKVKLTEIAIMDRQSNGSFIVKDRILDTYKVCEIISNKADNKTTSEDITTEISPKKNPTVIDKEYKNLRLIDDKISDIEKQLNDIEK
ncbi:MAG: DNA topoisomerase IV subunit A [Mycoplasmatota bacterium]|nr:DNA topoisomerase IV subunit A [Mycoplasmatota bacterium]